MCCHLLWLPPIKILRQCQTNQTWDSKSWFTVLTWLEILVWILDLMLVYRYFQILCKQDRQTRVISRDASASKYIIPTLSSLWTSWEQGSEPVLGKGSSVITFKDTTVSAMQEGKGLVISIHKLNTVLLCISSQFGSVRYGWELLGLVWLGTV